MKSIITILLGLFICLPLVGCGQGPAVVTVKDVNTSETITQAMAEEPTEAEKPLPKDLKSLKALAEKGDAEAQYSLGDMYYDGEGVEQNFKEAAKWTRKAADQGHATAQFNLGMMYERSQGVEKDDKEAVKWYLKSAEQGDAIAQMALGRMYYLGKGVEQDYVTAYAWSNIAAANGDEMGKLIKGNTAKKMTPAQIIKAEALAKEMIAKNPKLIKKP